MNYLLSLHYYSGTIRILVLCMMILPMTGCTTLCFADEDSRPKEPFEPGSRTVTRAYVEPSTNLERPPAISKSDISYENTTLSEDVTWRGTVLIRGYLAIAPQATLRIEPGTVVRFMKSAITRQLPRLVIMGRIQCNGTAEKPVLFAPNFKDAARGDWNGILLLASEKRNLLEYCRIEGAEKGLEALFSKITTKGLTVLKAGTGVLLRDSTATLSTTEINDCETGLEAYDSEVELRDGTMMENRRGIAAYHSSLFLASVVIRKSDQQGIVAENCRIKISGCELSGNAIGVLILKGEGQVLLSSFVRNSEVGLQLSGARIKVQRSQFTDNGRDGIRISDGRSAIWGSSFSGNGGYNLANTGREDVTAVLNWWGSDDESAITSKLLDAVKNTGSGIVTVSPWLSGKPAALP